MDSYSQLIERIANSSGIDVGEIDRRVEAKRAKLSGLISREGAAQIIAAELGISFENQRMKIGELNEGMKRARVVGKITKIFPVRSFEKNGRSGNIGSFQLGDDTSNVRVVLWDTNHIDLLSGLSEGDVVEIGNGSVRNGEVHLSAFGELKKSSEKIENVKENREMNYCNLKDAKVGGMKVRATVVQLFDPKYFDGKNGEKRALVNVVLDDGTETIRGVMGMEQLKSFGLSEEEILDSAAFALKKDNILGEECDFMGNCRINSYFNKMELSVSSVGKVDPEKLLVELESA